MQDELNLAHGMPSRHGMPSCHNLALAATLLALFAVNAEAAANMCKNPADLMGPNDMCTTFYNIEIAKHLSPSSWDSVTCAELCGNAAAVQHMHGYPMCCGGGGVGEEGDGTLLGAQSS